MATLLMVILVPRFLPSSLVPLGLGLHKSMEMASSSLSQTLSGMWLDGQEDSVSGGEGLLRIFWTINVLQLGCAVGLWLMEERKRKLSSLAEEYESLPLGDIGDELEREEQKVLHRSEPSSALASSDAESRRSKIFFRSALGFVVIVWVVFLADAWNEL